MTPVTRGRNDLWGGLIVAIGIVLAITAFAGVSLFQIGAVGFFVWLALARKQGWAWIPAAFFGFHLAQDLFDGVGGSLFFPLMVVAGGVLLLSRDRISKNATIGILIMLAVIGIASNNRDGAARIPEPDAPAEVTEEAPAPERILLPVLKGRSLVIDAGPRDVHLSKPAGQRGSVDPEHEFTLSEESDVVFIDLPVEGDRFDLTLPSEANVVVRTTSGDVETDELGGVGLTVDTVAGDIDIELKGPHAITAQTAEGQIEADGIRDFDESPDLLLGEARGSRVRLESLTGSISISQT